MVTDTPKNQPVLIADKYPQQDLFICDVADAVLKDLMPQMEHPFYALSKKPDTNIRRYEHNGNWIEITPSVKGLATIYDKDILIYCISQIVAKRQPGEDIKKRVRISSHDLLKFTNRGTAGKDYKALSEALDRLAGTTIGTNVRVDDKYEDYSVFSLIDAATIRREYGFEGRLVSCSVTLSDWVINAIRDNDVLTLHRDYFRLRKPIERRIYELARKHCGQQDEWSCGIDTLYKKSGSQSPVKHFRYLIKELVSNDHLPDYRVEFDEIADKVIFFNRQTMPLDKPKSWDGLISPTAFEKVAALRLEVDKYELEREFRSWLASKNIKPKNADAMFFDYAKKRKQQTMTGIASRGGR